MREVLDFMVKKALEYKLGARGLRSICEHILTDAMFELPEVQVLKFRDNVEYEENRVGKLNMLK